MHLCMFNIPFEEAPPNCCLFGLHGTQDVSPDNANNFESAKCTTIFILKSGGEKGRTA